ncbi:MAG: hypothetical protein QW478_14695, partial [Candidatus Micrarchaeaceae archaeon]
MQNPNTPLIDVFKLTPQVSGVFYWVLYYYATNSSNNYYITLLSLDNYYPPGSTNYNIIADLMVFNSNGQMGAKLSNKIFNDELNCYVSSNNLVLVIAGVPTYPPNYYGITSTYVCSYKYNSQYILYETDGILYLPQGQSAWIGVAPRSGGSANTWATARALAVWEVY